MRADSEPQQVLAALKAIGFTDRQLADVTSSSESTVAKWRSSTSPGPDASTKVDEIRALIGYLLAHGVAPRGAYAWLTAIDPELEWRSPLDWLGEDDFDRVRRRVQDFVPYARFGPDHARSGQPEPEDDEAPSDPEHAVLQD